MGQNLHRHFHILDNRKVCETIDQLQRRISERFPDSGLSRIAADLQKIATDTIARVQWIRRPNLPLRIVLFLVIAGCIGILIKIAALVRMSDDLFSAANFIQSFEALLSIFVFLGLTLMFIVGIESRLKRARAVEALYELKTLAHIVDMHQLTKDPEVFLLTDRATSSSPKRQMTAFELNRYFDYCSEILALISKIGALYVHEQRDPVIISVADQVEDLANGLSQKIWQKNSMLERVTTHRKGAA